MCIFQSGVGGAPAADSRFAVPCPSDRNALRNPLRKHAPTVMYKANGKERNKMDLL